MDKKLKRHMDKWHISDAEEFKADLECFGEDEVSRDTVDRILSSTLKKAGLEQKGVITMNKINAENKVDRTTRYSEVSHFRRGAAIAACLAIVAASTLAIKMLVGGNIGTDEDTTSKMQVTAQLPVQNSLPETSAADNSSSSEIDDSHDDSDNEVTEPDSSADSKNVQTDSKADESEPQEIILTDPYTDNDTESTPTESIREDVKQPTGSVEMTVDKLLSMSVSELKALSNNDYELVQAASAQAPHYGYKCAAFPEYVFCVNEATTTDVQPSDDVDYAVYSYGSDTWHRVLSDEKEQLNLYTGAYVGDGITVGMTYNEIKDICGDIYIDSSNDTLNLRAPVTIEGRKWYIRFELTDEQEDIVFERLYESVGGKENLTWDNPGHADISDMNPVSDCAVYFFR